jgi:hypothetical protein
MYRDDAETIEANFPKLNRRFTGYDLAHLRDGAGRFNLDSVPCDAEGTRPRPDGRSGR